MFTSDIHDIAKNVQFADFILIAYQFTGQGR